MSALSLSLQRQYVETQTGEVEDQVEEWESLASTVQEPVWDYFCPKEFMVGIDPKE